MAFSETFRDPTLLNSRVLQRFAVFLRPKESSELETMARDRLDAYAAGGHTELPLLGFWTAADLARLDD